MGRMRPSWYYRRQQEEAQRREDYRRTYGGPPQDTVLTPRGATVDLFYRSLFVRNGTDPQVFRVTVDAETVDTGGESGGLIPLANLGLLESPPENTFPLPLRGSGMKPSRASWYTGDATPRYERTEWQTSWGRYYQRGSHRS